MSTLDAVRLLEAGPLADLFAEQLSDAHRRAVEGVPGKVHFAGSDGDPWEHPADALARFVHRLGKEQLPKAKNALIELIARSRVHGMPMGVLSDTLYAIGLLQAADALPAAARAVLGATQWPRHRELQTTVMMVMKGLRGSGGATSAARLMLEDARADERLAIDAVQLLLADPHLNGPELKLHDVLLAAEGKLEQLMRPGLRSRFERRLRTLVRESLVPLPVSELATSMTVLLDGRDCLDKGLPLDFLLSLLLLDDVGQPPFQVVRNAGTIRLRRVGDGASAPLVGLTPGMADALCPRRVSRAVAEEARPHLVLET